MTDLRKAAEMALEALLTCDVDYDYDENPYNTFDAEDVSEAIEALRKALAQPEQEPVAYSNGKDGFIRADQVQYVLSWSDYYPEPLYASPPVSFDNSAKTVEEFKPDWDAIKPLVERIVELELEIRNLEPDVSTNFQNLDTSGQCTHKSDENV